MDLGFEAFDLSAEPTRALGQAAHKIIRPLAVGQVPRPVEGLAQRLDGEGVEARPQIRERGVHASGRLPHIQAACDGQPRVYLVKPLGQAVVAQSLHANPREQFSESLGDRISEPVVPAQRIAIETSFAQQTLIEVGAVIGLHSGHIEEPVLDAAQEAQPFLNGRDRRIRMYEHQVAHARDATLVQLLQDRERMLGVALSPEQSSLLGTGKLDAKKTAGQPNFGEASRDGLGHPFSAQHAPEGKLGNLRRLEPVLQIGKPIEGVCLAVGQDVLVDKVRVAVARARQPCQLVSHVILRCAGEFLPRLTRATPAANDLRADLPRPRRLAGPRGRSNCTGRRNLAWQTYGHLAAEHAHAFVPDGKQRGGKRVEHVGRRAVARAG
jgi:hypothetical protein